jgi:hypothetical protein
MAEPAPNLTSSQPSSAHHKHETNHPSPSPSRATIQNTHTHSQNQTRSLLIKHRNQLLNTITLPHQFNPCLAQPLPAKLSSPPSPSLPRFPNWRRKLLTAAFMSLSPPPPDLSEQKNHKRNGMRRRLNTN